MSHFQKGGKGDLGRVVGTERGISELQQLSGALRGQASDKPEKADRVARSVGGGWV